MALKVYNRFEIAKLAKEKGFFNGSDSYFEFSLTERNHETDDYGDSFSWKKNELNHCEGYFVNNSKYDPSSEDWFMCEAPTQSELQKWLREKHNIDVIVECDNNGSKFYKVRVWLDGNKLLSYLTTFETYEKALAEGLIYTLKNEI